MANKKVVTVVVGLAALAGVFALGYFAGGANVSEKNGTLVAPEDGELKKAQARIAELEAKLAKDRNGKTGAVLDKMTAKAETKKKDGKGDEIAVTIDGNNEDVISELKKNLPDEAFVATTNAISKLKRKLADRAKSRMDFLASIDVSQMSKEERENHSKYLEMLEKREAINARMKEKLIPDAETLKEMMTLEMSMHPVAKKERSTLVRSVARELGYAGEDIDVFHDTMFNVFDSTRSGGFGMEDVLDSVDPGEGTISIQTMGM